ncbi:MAG TPA: secondary thiamine-phosphate synthase enzyme YjbQ [Pyrinomonadaceae bacterium]|nr:secondary thiamine-phosphate synthase enzyme YjbQ [Pyrinomonadaceae bacterium]
MHKIRITADRREDMIDITRRAESVVAQLGKKEGICCLFVRHTTCALTINENADPDVQIDIIAFLRKLVPQSGQGFRHFEPNSDAHIKASLVGHSVLIPFADGELLLGRWQGIYLCEFDGPREREILLQIL